MMMEAFKALSVRRKQLMWVIHPMTSSVNEQQGHGRLSPAQEQSSHLNKAGRHLTVTAPEKNNNNNNTFHLLTAKLRILHQTQTAFVIYSLIRMTPSFIRHDLPHLTHPGGMTKTLKKLSPITSPSICSCMFLQSIVAPKLCQIKC